MIDRRQSVVPAAVLLMLLTTSGPAVSATPTDEAVSDAVRWRMAFGLDASLPHVLAVEASTKVIQEYGVALNASEASQMGRREKLNTDVDAAAAFLETVPDQSGSLYIDQAAGGTVVVQLVGSAAEVRDTEARVRGLLPKDVEVQIRHVEHTYVELRTIQEQLDADLPALTATGIHPVSTMVDEAGNVVRLGVSNTSSGAAEYVARKYGDVVAVVKEESGGPLTCNSRISCTGDDRLRAGLRIYGDNGGLYCTSGFGVRDEFIGSLYGYLLTAGHCVDPMDNPDEDWDWYHPFGTYIGTAEKLRFFDGADADVAAVHIIPSRTGNCVWQSTTTICYAISQNELTANQSQGEFVRMSGGNSGYHTGSISGRFTHEVWAGWFDLYNQFRVNITTAIGGDSGSPIYANSRAYGILSGGNASYIHYTPIQTIEDRLGLKTCHSSTCPDY
jgi:hypothetical protein